MNTEAFLETESTAVYTPSEKPHVHRIIDMLRQCRSADERYALVYMMADFSGVERRFIGNQWNGWTVLDFDFEGTRYTYSPQSGPDGSGEWYVIRKGGGLEATLEVCDY
jgi:hypothetical protein